MGFRYIIGVIVLLVFYSKAAISVNRLDNSMWIYDKTSERDVLGHYDFNMITHLRNTYRNVTIKSEGKILLIKNSDLKEHNVCLTDYVEMEKTPLSYYLSQKSVKIYRGLFEGSNITLPENLYILPSLYSGRECPSPYAEIVKVNDHLTVVAENYIIFFRKVRS